MSMPKTCRYQIAWNRLGLKRKSCNGIRFYRAAEPKKTKTAAVGCRIRRFFLTERIIREERRVKQKIGGEKWAAFCPSRFVGSRVDIRQVQSGNRKEIVL
jgi:hypothetical protein